MNPNSFHFKKFKIKHFFLNIWKEFLNWAEVKFYPEFTEPRFERTEIKKEPAPVKEFFYKEPVDIISGFYK